jgi:type I restriction enzyme M protein
LDKETFDLSVKNPNTPGEDPLRSPEEILNEIEKLDKKAGDILKNIREII